MSSEFKDLYSWFSSIFNSQLIPKISSSDKSKIESALRTEFERYIANFNVPEENYKVLILAIFYIIWYKMEFARKYGHLTKSILNYCKRECNIDLFNRMIIDYNKYDHFRKSKDHKPTVMRPTKETKINPTIVKLGNVDDMKRIITAFIEEQKEKERKKGEAKIGSKCGYNATGLLGKGSYGTVYSVIDRGESKEGKQYALKLMNNVRTSCGNLNNDTLGEIIDGIYFKHPNVISIEKVIPWCKDSSALGILLPLAIGTLKDLIESDAFSIWKSKSLEAAKGIKALMFRLAHDIISGLNYIHKLGFMHLDIKTQNILIFLDDRFGARAVISDFGLAENIKGRRSRDPNEVFTITYREPRLTCAIDNNYGPSSDIWALGLVLAKLFLNENLFTSFKNEFNIDDPMISSDEMLDLVDITDDFIRDLTSSSLANPENPYIKRCQAIIEDHKELDYKPPYSSIGKSLEFTVKPFNRTVLYPYWFTPTEYKDIWQAIDACLEIDPKDRPSAEDLLKFPLFTDLPSAFFSSVIEPTEVKVPEVKVPEVKEVKVPEVKEVKERKNEFKFDVDTLGELASFTRTSDTINNLAKGILNSLGEYYSISTPEDKTLLTYAAFGLAMNMLKYPWEVFKADLTCPISVDEDVITRRSNYDLWKYLYENV